MLDVAADHDAGVWAEPEAVAGRGEGAVSVDGALSVSWDVTDARGPHVYGVEGGYLITTEPLDGGSRLGRLRAITPTD
ncbi:hypothetical protein BOO71_0002425 [Deinococcus marmoris]|uniref:Uncharacterized protein n=2 Tax=Deinococcus marmoris TaxID=249408 RepID=A0A1U7P318_9DEIO|nr:hypothetical protein BOO71_0002425 [Deinococcus marmoris]